MNPNIMKTYFFYKIKYDFKGYIRSNKAFYVSSVKPTLPLMLPPNYVRDSHPDSHQKRGGRFSICSLDVETQIIHKIMYDIKARSHEATFMLWRGCAI